MTDTTASARPRNRRVRKAATVVIVCVLIAVLAGRPLLSTVALLGVTFGWS
ncbi:hypothetical protein [Gordonia sp. FQ]|uniref:hypothetical protein n=1 Tax=Gordonia sp. FQ TaxID=3446634 RepID=UPI003F825331